MGWSSWLSSGGMYPLSPVWELRDVMIGVILIVVVDSVGSCTVDLGVDSIERARGMRRDWGENAKVVCIICSSAGKSEHDTRKAAS